MLSTGIAWVLGCVVFGLGAMIIGMDRNTANLYVAIGGCAGLLFKLCGT